jgi:sugar-specific transcriptional regulator TrmB
LIIGIAGVTRMNIREQDVAVLRKLGLTQLEAEIYIISSRIGKEKIERIASLAEIDRSNAYNIIRKLQKAGLTSEILGKPNLYESLPVKEAISILLKSKEEEFKSLEKEAKDFARSNDLERKTYTDSYQFKVYRRSKKSMEQSVIKVCKNAIRSFDLIISETTFAYLFINLAPVQLNCVKRGVEYRILTEKTALEKFRKEIHPFIEYDNFHIRVIPARLRVQITISDGETASLHLIPNEIFQEYEMLQTNHNGCVEIFQKYFDIAWSESQEYNNLNGLLPCA